MASVKWIKIATDIFDDEKILLIESMPEADAIIVIWFKLLCLAGKQNNSGVFMMNNRIAYTDEMLATIFRRNVNVVRLALSTFEKFGMIEIVNDAITIPNWDKHQQLDALEKSRDNTRKRVQKFRAKQKLLAGETECNVTETFGNADRIDKNRIDKTIIEGSNNINVDVINKSRACACAREEPNNDDENYNPFGDGGPEHPEETLEVYAANNIVNMNGRNMEYLAEFKKELPEPLIRFGIDSANKYSKTGVPTWAYVETILKSFVARKFKTVEQAQMAEKARGQERTTGKKAEQKESVLFGEFY